jgi:hypothetical protein
MGQFESNHSTNNAPASDRFCGPRAISNGLIESVHSIIASRALKSNLVRNRGRIDLADTDNKRACQGVWAFANKVNNDRGKTIPPVLGDEWIPVTNRMRSALGCAK